MASSWQINIMILVAVMVLLAAPTYSTDSPAKV
jgi:hypothetical protein